MMLTGKKEYWINADINASFGHGFDLMEAIMNSEGMEEDGDRFTHVDATEEGDPFDSNDYIDE